MTIYLIIYSILFFYAKNRLKNKYREDVKENQKFWGDKNFIFEKTIIYCFYLLIVVMFYLLALSFYYPENLKSLITELEYFQKVENYISYMDYLKEASFHLKIINLLTILPFYLPMLVSVYFIIKKVINR